MSDKQDQLNNRTALTDERSSHGTYRAQAAAARKREYQSKNSTDASSDTDLADKDSNLEATQHNVSPVYLFIKRFFDIVFSVAVIVILFPVFILLVIAIKVDDPEGSAIFRQKRIGKDGKTIRIFKFRSMYVDAHEHPERYFNREQMMQWRREQKVDDDPRITKIGKFIRRTSIDEFPQFLNVLSGDMSVIGPRPVTLKETYEFGENRSEVLSVRPGITGWWQVTDRNDATWENGRRQELELWYVRHMSLLTDVKVFLSTIKAMLKGTGK